MRITVHYVSAHLRERLQRYALSSCTCLDQVRSLEAVVADPQLRRPVVMIGLRVENRTHHDLIGLLERLLTRIATRYPGFIAILEGHNTRAGAGGDMIESHGESAAPEQPVHVERQLAHQLRQRLASVDVQIHDTIGQPMSNSLVLSAASDCFFAVWGACLAKFRWVANKPGVAITSQTNIHHRGDLLIYHTSENMEAPTRMVIPRPEWVRDLPTAPILVDAGPGESRFFNFEIDEEPIFDIMLDIVSHALS